MGRIFDRMSKTITAVGVMQLVEAGRVGLDDPVERYVDSLPYGSSVTVRQLISHTSGIPNPIPLRWVHPEARHGSFDENAALATVLRDHQRLSFEPGTKYAYSNIGYWLLGKVVEGGGSIDRSMSPTHGRGAFAADHYRCSTLPEKRSVNSTTLTST